MAALEALQLAFPLPHLPATFGRECNYHPLSERVALLIKTFLPQDLSAEWRLHETGAASRSVLMPGFNPGPLQDQAAACVLAQPFPTLLAIYGYGNGPSPSSTR